MRRNRSESPVRACAPQGARARGEGARTRAGLRALARSCGRGLQASGTLEDQAAVGCLTDDGGCRHRVPHPRRRHRLQHHHLGRLPRGRRRRHGRVAPRLLRRPLRRPRQVAGPAGRPGQIRVESSLGARWPAGLVPRRDPRPRPASPSPRDPAETLPPTPLRCFCPLCCLFPSPSLRRLQAGDRALSLSPAPVAPYMSAVNRRRLSPARRAFALVSRPPAKLQGPATARACVAAARRSPRLPPDRAAGRAPVAWRPPPLVMTGRLPRPHAAEALGCCKRRRSLADMACIYHS